MRITDGSAPGNIDGASSKIKDTSPAHSTSGQGITAENRPGDKLSFGRGQELVQLAFELGTASRQDRVTEVRTQLEQGTYRVEAQDVSRGILHEALLLGRHGLLAES